MSIQKPELEKADKLFGDCYRHPAYAQIIAARTSGGNNHLYGSDFGHNNTIRIEINASKVYHRNGVEHPMAVNTIIEVELSESQWATFVSSLNVGSGVPCTIRQKDGKPVPRIPPPEDRRANFNKELHDTMTTAVEHAKELRKMLEDSGMSKKKIDEMVRQLNMVTMNITANTDFVAQVFGEHMEETVEKAKTEIEAYMVSTVMRAGLTALQGSENALTLGFDNSNKALK